MSRLISRVMCWLFGHHFAYTEESDYREQACCMCGVEKPK
jgi:hypothetical protein